MRAFITVLLVIAALFFWLGNHSNDVTLERTASGTIKYTDDFKVHLTQTEGIFETFMVFGGHIDKRLQNSISDYSFGVLEIGEATAIKQKYPDFNQCKSPGAAIAQRKIRTISLIAEDKETAETLEETVALHDEHLSEDGDRVCVEIRGSRVELSTILLKENDMDISKDIIPSFRNSAFYLIDGAEIRDCEAMM
jgi:hypothetical protein